MNALIIGVDHHYQTGSIKCSNEDIECYTITIELLVNLHSITAIVEEMNEEGLKNYGVKSTLAQDVANKHGIKHIFIDPSESERKHLGIIERGRVKIMGVNNGLNNEQIERQMLEQDIKRENYWLLQILKNPKENIVFVCGSNHSERFFNLLLKNNIKAELVSDNWKP